MSPRTFGHALSLTARYLGGILLASCASLSGGARDTFAASHTCPPDRVSVTPRPNLNRGSFMSPRPAPTPPPEVAGDPERLRFWQEQQQKAEAAGAADVLPCDVFELTGCGHRQFLCCTHHFHDEHGGTPSNPTQTRCDDMPGSPGGGPG
jgi:hypothetical protein